MRPDTAQTLHFGCVLAAWALCVRSFTLFRLGLFVAIVSEGRHQEGDHDQLDRAEAGHAYTTSEAIARA